MVKVLLRDKFCPTDKLFKRQAWCAEPATEEMSQPPDKSCNLVPVAIMIAMVAPVPVMVIATMVIMVSVAMTAVTPPVAASVIVMRATGERQCTGRSENKHSNFLHGVKPFLPGRPRSRQLHGSVARRLGFAA